MPPRVVTIKQLYRQLRIFQAEDVIITAPVMLQIKFELKYHGGCNQIFIDNPTPSDNKLHLEISIYLNQLLPQFLLSQLEAQRIADGSRSSLQLGAALAVATSFLDSNPTESPTYPTLFCWSSSENHRNYYLFAFLVCNMEARSYSAAELLKFNTSKCPQTLQGKLESDPVLSVIAKDKPTAHPKRPQKAKESSSSTESESHGFQAKEQPSAVDGETQWKYRGRLGSEVGSDGPIPAPPGKDAQRVEGFKRFFKAVVSPTHVRVTAGGRIVPNTRASTSPTAKWDKNRPVPDVQGQQSTATAGEAETTKDTDGHPTHPSLWPGYAGFPTMFPVLPSPMTATYPGQPGVPPGQPGIPPGYQLSRRLSVADLRQNQPPHVDKRSEGHTTTEKRGQTAEHPKEQKKPRPAPIKISPPEQFDHRRPFFYNGYFIYPPAGSAPPHGLLSNPPTLAGPYWQNNAMIGNTLPSSAPIVPPSQNQQAFHANKAHQMIPFGMMPGPQTANLVENNGPWGLAGPPQQLPMTTIRTSSITKHQLDNLRASLKYFEDQLLYNKHQIDERHVRTQADNLKGLINQFQANYNAQLHLESAYTGKFPLATRPVGITAGPDPSAKKAASRHSSQKENSSDVASQSGSIRSFRHTGPGPHRTGGFDEGRPNPNRGRKHLTVGINSNVGANTTAAMKAMENHLNSAESNKEGSMMKKPSLPSRAALARPFEPRGASALQGDMASDLSSTNEETFPMPSQDEIRASFPAPYDVGAWTAIPTATHQRQQSLAWGDTQGPFRPAAPRLACAGAQFYGQQMRQNASAPYLVGQLPMGVNPANTNSAEYIYGRELTYEERRARFAYWGKLPSKGLGLPKFDGKDFYPPSPVKPLQASDGATGRGQRRLPTGRPEIDYDFEVPVEVPKVKQQDPFRSSLDNESIRSQAGSVKPSRAVPIVAPEDAKRTAAKDSAPSKDVRAGQGDGKPSPRMTPAEGQNAAAASSAVESAAKEQKPHQLVRKAPERSNIHSSKDLWQSMVKKGPTGGAALPSAISSTTATGYLPQYFGHAAASLTPAISSTNASPPRSSLGQSSKQGESQLGAPATQLQLPAGKAGENCPPPREMSAKEIEAFQALHQQMLRDAERRGVIPPSR